MVTSVAKLYTPESIARSGTERTVQIHKGTAFQSEEKKNKRVAAYCRVSTDKAEQLESLENQMESFRYQLSLHDDWELVGIYADEG